MSAFTVPFKIIKKVLKVIKRAERIEQLLEYFYDQRGRNDDTASDVTENDLSSTFRPRSKSDPSKTRKPSIIANMKNAVQNYNNYKVFNRNRISKENPRGVYTLMIVDDDGKVIEKMSLSDLMTYLNLRPCDENSAKAEGSSISLRDQDSINTMQESVAAQSETSVSADNNDSCRINGREILFVILYLFILLFFSYIFFYFLHF